MKTTFAVISALFAASSALALPAGGPQVPPSTSQTVTVSFSNDQSGRNAPITTSLDGSAVSISSYLANSPLYNNGDVQATSAYLVAFPQGANCVITAADGHIITGLDDQKTFADLDGNPNAAIPVSLHGATLICEI